MRPRQVACTLLWLLPFYGCGSERKPLAPIGVEIIGGEAGIGGASAGDAGAAAMGLGGDRMRPDIEGAPCNGRADLCGRRYDEVVVPVAHAAMANSADVWSFPAQTRSLRQQLDDSMRGLWLEVRLYDAKPTLCFGACENGRSPLVAELAQIRSFLDDNPREIVTLLVDNYVPATLVAAAFDEADLTRSLATVEPAAPWPTLAELLMADARLVVFLRDAEEAPVGYLPLDASIRQTSSHAQTVRDLTCEVTQGAAQAPLLLLNQFLVQPEAAAPSAGPGGSAEGGAAGAAGTLGAAETPNQPGRPSAELAADVNRNPELMTRLQRCAQSLGQKPNFVAVDFYDASDVVTATQQLNGLVGPITE